MGESSVQNPTWENSSVHPPPLLSLPSPSLAHTHVGQPELRHWGVWLTPALQPSSCVFITPVILHPLWTTFLRSNLLQLCITCKRHRCLHQGQKRGAKVRKEQQRSKTWHKTEPALKQQMTWSYGMCPRSMTDNQTSHTKSRDRAVGQT